MKNKENKLIYCGLRMLMVFALFTVAVKTIDVQTMGVNGSEIGFAALNCWFHQLTGVNFTLYTITDWLGIIPLCVCAIFGLKGLVQLLQRKGIFKVDIDIIMLGVYYVMVIFSFMVFEIFPVNYRPVLINGAMEASYPSSTTLLVITIMPALAFNCARNCKNKGNGKIVSILANAFAVAMVVARTLSGVHWLTDIIAALLLGTGLFCVYKGRVLLYDNKK